MLHLALEAAYTATCCTFVRMAGWRPVRIPNITSEPGNEFRSMYSKRRLPDIAHLWEIDLRFAHGLPPGWWWDLQSRGRRDGCRQRGGPSEEGTT